MAAIKLLETLSLVRVRGSRIPTTLFHITSSWPVQRGGIGAGSERGGVVCNHYYIF
jgi:hypothetical protein